LQGKFSKKMEKLAWTLRQTDETSQWQGNGTEVFTQNAP
jgi:hypothetical protein